MPQRLDPKLDVLPQAQQEIWPALRPTRTLGFVLYGGTALALQLGHRQSVDFDFFNIAPLNKDSIRATLPFAREGAAIQDEPNTLVVMAPMPSGPVKVSFFGGISIGRVADPLLTKDDVLEIASMDDLMATKLKVILDRAEAKGYRDIAAMISVGVSLTNGLSAFRAMYGGEPAVVLKALGYFDDGDLASVPEADRQVLRAARDRVRDIPEVTLLRPSTRS